MPNPRIKKIAESVKSKIKQKKEQRSKRASEASARLEKRGINPSGLTEGQKIRYNKKLTKSDLRGKTTSTMEEFQQGRANIEKSKQPKVVANISGNISSSSSSDSGSKATINNPIPETGKSGTINRPRPKEATPKQETFGKRKSPMIDPPTSEETRRDLKNMSSMLMKIKNPQKKY